MHNRKILTIKLSTATHGWPLTRQTPACSGKWGNFQFVFNTDIEECDFWFVYDGLSHEEKTICSKENVILITGEPPTVKSYKQEFISQFNTIITCNRNIKHPKVFYSQQALPWMVGGRFYKRAIAGRQNLLKITMSSQKLIRAIKRNLCR
jgi:hypothetical protein